MNERQHSFYNTKPMRIHIRPEDQARIEQHWADVRAGLHVDAPHTYGDDRQSVIDMHRFLARRLIEQAAVHAKKAIELEEAPK